MLGLDLPLVRRDGTVVQLAGAGSGSLLGLPRVASELIRSARRLRVFVMRPATVPAAPLIALVMSSVEEVRGRLEASRPLLGRR